LKLKVKKLIDCETSSGNEYCNGDLGRDGKPFYDLQSEGDIGLDGINNQPQSDDLFFPFSVGVYLNIRSKYNLLHKLIRWYKDSPWMVERPIKDTFEYYMDIPSYQSRYPRYYGKTEVIFESTGILRTKEFLNLSLDPHREHLSIEVEYQIDEPHKISFKITGKDFIKRIPSGGLTFSPQVFYLNGIPSEGTLVNGTISTLEIMSYPPGSKDSSQYEEMLLYFGEKDMEFLEGYTYKYKPGQQCTICGKGQLQISGKKEYTEKERDLPLKSQQTTIEVLLCNYCGHSFETNFIMLK